MAILKVNENPTITDTIVFDIDTPGADGCYLTDPYKVEKITIYFVARDFNSGNLKNYEVTQYDVEKLKAAEEAEAIACSDPTEENILVAKKLRNAAEDSKNINNFYYKEAEPVAIFGSEDYPVWLSTYPNDDILEHVTEDSVGNTLYGRFQFTWEPQGAREGDYFICWTWMPLPAGVMLSSHQKFSLLGNTQSTTSIPTHFTNPKKYKTLLDRYLPEMFKTSLSETDVTKDVLDRMNNSISMGFNTLEDLTNQMVDLLDANALHEFLIPYLSNLFGLKLKTDDPTRWRGQIKRAVPLYKKKGTKSGISEALEHGGVTLHKINQLWQIISSYTWQESFTYDGSNNEFILEKAAILPIDPANFELWFRASNQTEWIQLDETYVSLTTTEGVSSFIWLGDDPLTVIDPIPLVLGDEIRILYLYQDIPNETSQTIEDYIRTLPLMDTRDSKNQTYPPKNWNVRVISEEDPMFSIVIPNRNPFCDCLVYGKIRTEFPYSENIYNMDEYNGSIRDSKNPCDIDKEFVDPCTACVSSSYNLDVEIEELSDDRVEEVREIIKENAPFHAVIHTLNFTAGLNEFVGAPVENVEMLTTYSGGDFVVAGYAQTYFHRLMKDVENKGILREDLANSVSVYSGSGNAYNDEITLFCPSTFLGNVGIDSSGGAFVDIKSPTPSPLVAGEYNVVASDGHTVAFSLVSVGEPLTDCCDETSSEPPPYPSCISSPLSFECCPPYPQYDDCPRNSIFYCSHLNNCSFTFDLNNTVDPINGTLCNIDQDNIYKIKDYNESFISLGIKTQKDVDNGTASYAWTIYLPDYNPVDFTILDITSDGSILIEHDSSLPSSNTDNVTYRIRNNGVDVVLENGDVFSDNGIINVYNRAKITVLNPSCIPVAPLIKHKKCYQKIGSVEYLITGIVDGTNDQFYIEGYSGGDSAGVSANVRERLVENKIGYLSFKGIKLRISGVDLETSLGIQNGASYVSGDMIENNRFKENFIVYIDDVMYWIADINGNYPTGDTTITLLGPGQYWGTEPFGGTVVNIQINRYDKLGATIEGQQYELPEHTFETLDRNGRPVIRISELYTNNDISLITLSDREKIETKDISNNNEINDFVGQKEEITFQIDYKNKEGEEK